MRAYRQSALEAMATAALFAFFSGLFGALWVTGGGLVLLVVACVFGIIAAGVVAIQGYQLDNEG